jgi:hypothetical protein
LSAATFSLVCHLLYLRSIKPPLVSELKQDEELIVTHGSWGCFHSSVLTYRFAGNKVHIYNVTDLSSRGRPAEDYSKDTYRGTVHVSRWDKKGLDRLFWFYAKGSDGGCSTQDLIIIKHMSGSNVLKRVEYFDGSCETIMSENTFITLNDLSSRLDPPLRLFPKQLSD